MSDQAMKNMEEGGSSGTDSTNSGICSSSEIVQLTQKVIAEVIGTYFVIFIGCGSVAVNKIYGSVTFPGIAITWGLIVMVMVYAVGHISGAHFNPAVTVTFAIFRHFPIKEVPLYVVAQVLGSILASGTLCLLLDVPQTAYFGVATDNRAIGELAGIAVGMTIVIDVFVAGPVSGASMNPARSLGPAIVMHTYKGLWIYFVGPIVGTVLGGFAYNLIRFTDKPLRELTRSASFIKSLSTKP
ncbi:hypothetical protein CerSpe_034670 [Prunus speciosa]